MPEMTRDKKPHRRKHRRARQPARARAPSPKPSVARRSHGPHCRVPKRSRAATRTPELLVLAPNRHAREEPAVAVLLPNAIGDEIHAFNALAFCGKPTLARQTPKQDVAFDLRQELASERRAAVVPGGLGKKLCKPANSTKTGSSAGRSRSSCQAGTSASAARLNQKNPYPGSVKNRAARRSAGRAWRPEARPARGP